MSAENCRKFYDNLKPKFEDLVVLNKRKIACIGM
jgi:hypothetical protein